MAELDLEQGLTVLERRMGAVQIGIYAFLGFSVMNILSSLGTLTGAIDLEAPSLLTGAAGLALISYALALVASIIVVTMWIYRAHANLRAAGIDGLEFSPGWAVGWYFIPIANLFKPFQAMRELWNTTHGQSDGYTQPTDSRLTTWWGTWIAGNILSNIGTRLGSYGGSESSRASEMIDILAVGLLMAAAWFLLQIVQSVTAAQRDQVGVAATFA
jgi:hypothetical protein